MSSITQARLAPITQRYMSMSFRRQEWNERLASSSPSDESMIEKNFKNGHHSTSSNQRYKSSRPLSLHLFGRERKFLKRQPEYRGCPVDLSRTLTSGSSVGLGSNHLICEDTTTNHQFKSEDDLSIYQTYTYLSHRDELPSMVGTYLPRAKQEPGTLLDVDAASTIPPLSQGNLLLRYWKRERSRRNNRGADDRGDSFNQKPFYVTLAVLGMFRKPTEREIEEGRAQLTDEQKAKKMKPVELKIAKGVLSMSDQEYSRANQLFHEALHMAQDEADEEQENLVLNLIAANYFESGDLENAEKLFIDIMKRMIAHDTSPTAPPILELSLKLASIYSKNPATHEKALKGFKFVINSLLYNLEDLVNNIEDLDIQSVSADRRDQLALLGWSYDWFAKHLLAMNDYGGAADMLQRAVQISSLVLGPLHDQTLILLNDIGTTLAMNNSPEEGKIFIRKAVEGAIANQSKELASFYVNLGLVNLKLSKLDEAKRYCEYSMELAKKNRDHYNTQEVIELSRTCLNEVQKLLDAEGQ